MREGARDSPRGSVQSEDEPADEAHQPRPDDRCERCGGGGARTGGIGQKKNDGEIGAPQGEGDRAP